jgi:hypothetical protein
MTPEEQAREKKEELSNAGDWVMQGKVSICLSAKEGRTKCQKEDKSWQNERH